MVTYSHYNDEEPDIRVKKRIGNLRWRSHSVQHRQPGPSIGCFKISKKKGKKWAFFCHYQNLSRYLTKCSIKRSSFFVSYWFRKKNWSYFLTLINVSRAKHKLLRAYRFSIPRYFCTEFAIGRWSYRTNAVPMRFSRSGNSCVIIPIINVDIETRQIMAR